MSCSPRRFALVLSLASLLLLGCGRATTPGSGAKPPGAASPWKGKAARGVHDAELAALARAHWQWRMQNAPVWATTLGDRRYDDKLGDGSWRAAEARQKERLALLARARALLPRAPRFAHARDRATLALLVGELEAQAGAHRCKMPLWDVDPRGNPLTQFNGLPRMHSVKSAEHARTLEARYRLVPAAIRREIADLRHGLQQGLVANAESVRRVIAMLRSELAKPIARWALLTTPKRRARLDDAGRARLVVALEPIVAGPIRDALRAYLALLEKEILPAARRGKAPPGLSGLAAKLPGCYAARIRLFTGLPLAAAELHATGKREVARIDAAMQALGKKLFGLDDRAAVLHKLRSDPKLSFDSAAAVEAKAKSALARARARIAKFFGRLPKADCVVTRIPDYEAKFTTVAYYSRPYADGKPGEYFINVSEPTTRPRYEAEALAYHEAIPGHHLQIAIAQELTEMPAFRRYSGNSAFVEGWGLYAESLADEMGLYSGDLDRLGMLSYDAWRATRLVVDTGLHAMGWSRKQAIDYMTAHSALASNNISNEVDRYIVWPGQALSYKVGQLEIKRLRADARHKLGARFSLPAFHDAVLGGGAVSLPVLRQRVAAYLAASR
ncbi:MAG: DUF885 domain-containing protein [Myxococcales bacterium]|nr:DUF885 domain-containing protein [Myxococcales bacterium]